MRRIVTTDEVRDDVRRIIRDFPGKAGYPLGDSYYTEWLCDETDMRWVLGCPDFRDRETLVFIVEAARQLNGGDHETTRKLLKLAADHLRVV